MMLSHFQHLVDVEGLTWERETALRGATERVVPVTMTALVTGLGLLPVALSAGRAGGEIDGPMAIVILGGLATSTALTLLALPALALRFGRFEATRGRLSSRCPGRRKSSGREQKSRLSSGVGVRYSVRRQSSASMRMNT